MILYLDTYLNTVYLDTDIYNIFQNTFIYWGHKSL